MGRIIDMGLALVWAALLLGCSAPAQPGKIPQETVVPLVQATILPTSDPSPAPLALAAGGKLVVNAHPSPTPIATFTPAPPFVLCSPLASDPLADLPQIISDPYRPPPPHHDERHQGVDFSYYRRNGRTSIEGVGVQSVLPGKVAAAVTDSFPFGNMIIIETSYIKLPAALAQKLGLTAGESLYALYAHLEKPPAFNPGDEVTSCQVLGEVGKTGNAAIAHLHFETRSGPAGATFAGMRYYDLHATQLEKDNYVLWSMSGIFRHFNPMDLLSWGEH